MSSHVKRQANVSRHRAAAILRSSLVENLEGRRFLCASHGLGVGRLDLGTFPTLPVGGDTITSTSPTATLSGVPLSSVPQLNSLPAASKRVYLDFTGAPATSWGSYSVPTTPAYDQDGDASTFSSGELSNIQDIWTRVSEKFSPYNINVTTVDPGTYASGVTLRVVVGGDSAWLGSAAGGVAYINSFTSVSQAGNTVWVFPKNLGNGTPKYVAEASAHESGHGFGLQHQSTYDSTGTKTAEYNPGNSQVAPIMGNSYSTTRGLWWNGTSAVSSTSIQDDMAIISRSTNGFGYRPDDVGNTVSTASPLSLSGSAVSGSGVITQTSDVDMFSFTTDAGSITLSGNTLGGNSAMLDLKLSLYTSTGVLVASADTTSLGESFTVNLAGGSYRLAVASHGSYGDVGQYTISGIVVTPTNVVAAPTNLAATANGTDVSLTWADNSTNEDQFTLSRSTDPTFAVGTTTVILPANTTSYTEGGLTNGSTYYYRIVASNASSTSDVSNTASVTIVPVAPVLNSATTASANQVNVAWTDVVGETGYQVQKSTDQVTWSSAGTAAANATSLSVTGLNASTTYYFRVLATNAGGSSVASNVLSATTSAPPALPLAPSGLLATATSGTRVNLTWTDNASTETGFYIERSNNGGKSYTQIASVGANVTAWTDTTVTKRKTYQYRVRAYNGTGVSGYSNVATVTTPAAAAGSPLLSGSLGGSDDDQG